MTIRKKIISIFIVILSSLILGITLISGFFLIREVNDNEFKNSTKDIERALSAFSIEFEDLERITQDYAGWDDTYEFITNQNEKYIHDNIILDTYSKNGFYFMVFLNLSGEISYSKIFDTKEKKEIPLSEELKGIFSDKSSFITQPVKNGKMSGIWKIDNQPMLITSFPILNSHYEGPARGVLVIGRLVNEVLQKKIMETTQLKISLIPVYDPSIPKEINAIYDKGSIAILPVDDDRITGYGLLKDGFGKPAYLLRMESPRLFRQESIRNLMLLLGMLIMMGVVTCILSVYLLKKIILNRLTRLNEFIQTAQSDISATHYFRDTGNDEFSNFARGFNTLLEKIELHLAERKRMEEELLKAKKELERNVEERTAELILANDLLRNEINERKQVEESLQHKIADISSRGRH